jgi:dihydrofolate synthase/folylpolyglutamate synthase
MDFQQAQDYLLSLGNEVVAMKLGLENIRKLLTALDEPQKNYLKIQIAGTNGKGSVCAFLNAICVSAGVRVGMFTSPHLISITERVQIDGVPISADDFAKYATKVRTVAEKLLSNRTLESIPTFFEQVTAIALLVFAESKVELAILETGLGGRLDATTAANAEIAVITRIDYDHQEYLGETIQEIAAEKAAIIRPDSRVVIGEQTSEAMNVILDRTAALAIQPRLAAEVTTSCGSGWLKFESPPNSYDVKTLGLPGRHQIHNAKTALAAAELLSERIPIVKRNIVDGLENAKHPGRLEFIGRFLLDGAHNVGGARALRAFIDQEINQPIILIFGAMRDKDVEAIAREIFPAAQIIILTEPTNSRTMKASEILTRMPSGIVSTVYETHAIEEAFRKAEQVSTDNSMIIVTGSLYLVGEARKLLLQSQDLKFEVSNLR